MRIVRMAWEGYDVHQRSSHHTHPLTTSLQHCFITNVLKSGTKWKVLRHVDNLAGMKFKIISVLLGDTTSMVGRGLIRCTPI